MAVASWTSSQMIHGQVAVMRCLVRPSQLPHILRGGLQDAYVSVLREDLPEEWARCLSGSMLSLSR